MYVCRTKHISGQHIEDPLSVCLILNLIYIQCLEKGVTMSGLRYNLYKTSIDILMPGFATGQFPGNSGYIHTCICTVYI